MTYEHCEGTVTFKFLGYYNVTATESDNEFHAGKLFLTVGSNEEVQIGSFDHGTGEFNYTGGGPIWDDDNYYSRIPLGSTYQDVVAFEDPNDPRYFYWIITYKLLSPLYDNSWGDNVTFRITGSWNDTDPINLSKSIATTQTSPPTDLTASNDEYCNSVLLSWNNPTDNTCTSTMYETEIYRDGSYLAEVPFDSETFSDYSAVKGQTYDYKIRAKLNTNNSGYNRSSFTPVTQGKRIGPLGPPSSFAASNNNCDGLIDLSWQWNTANPEKFQYRRSPVSDFSSGVYTSPEINSDLRSFEDIPPIKNSVYYFEVIYYQGLSVLPRQS
ncbi:hypothetical protein LCGC14_2662510 [marine sediment metagenome]|uniref:Fibronectin type-III domain-containing protein n=1 Tax=marine sediment metagenome TaxID=412755 RepID=A0A0F9C1R5_9ZZZZ